MSDGFAFVSIDLGGTALKGLVGHWPAGPVSEIGLPSRNLRLLNDKEVTELLRQCLAQVPKRFPKSGVVWLVGAAGARPHADQNRITESITRLGNLPQAVFVWRDFEANHAATFGGEEGILSVNGTGSVIYARRGTQELRRGGWGYLLDEIPSGAAFGRLALQAMLQAAEGHPDREIWQAFGEQAFPDCPDRRAAILDALYASDTPQTMLGRFAPLLAKAHGEGCPWTRKAISFSLSQWAEEMARLACDLHFPCPVPWSGCGGLWAGWSAFPGLALGALATQSGLPLEFAWVPPVYPTPAGPLIHYLTHREGGFTAEKKDQLSTLVAHLPHPTP